VREPGALRARAAGCGRRAERAGVGAAALGTALGAWCCALVLGARGGGGGGRPGARDSRCVTEQMPTVAAAPAPADSSEARARGPERGWRGGRCPRSFEARGAGKPQEAGRGAGPAAAVTCGQPQGWNPPPTPAYFPLSCVPGVPSQYPSPSPPVSVGLVMGEESS
jgi:hypothetical protein